MGNNQSSPKSEQRNSRNVSQAEVEKALERQRQIYEQRMEDLVKRQAATRDASQSGPGQSAQTAPRQSAQSAPGQSWRTTLPSQLLRPPPQRPECPPHNVGENTNLERQRSPYSYTQNNLTGAVQPTTAQLPSNPQSLYPNLDNRNSPLPSGNNNHTARQSSVTTANINSPLPSGYNNHTARQSHVTTANINSPLPSGNNNHTARQSPITTANINSPLPSGNNKTTARQSPTTAANRNSPLPSGNNNHTARQSPVTTANINSPLPSGNNNHTGQQSPVTANNNDFVFVNSYFKKANVTPSAPPAPSSPPSRQRSVSRPRSQLGNENEINCPTCKKRFGLKIFNCSSGHASCMNCKMEQRNCGICNYRITDMRNISVEEYVSQFKVPCLNASEGCTLNFKLGEMDNHVKECPFREIQCLLPGGMCLWKGKLSVLAMHFENFHPSHKSDVDTEMSLQMHNMCGNKQMQLIKLGNFNFLFHLIVSESDDKIYIAVQLLGTKFSAAKWKYEIHMYDKGAPRRKYQYSDICLSNTETLTDLMKESRCAVIPLQYAKTFINHGAINYRCFITKEYAAKGQTRRDQSNARRGGRGRGRGGFNKN